MSTSKYAAERKAKKIINTRVPDRHIRLAGCPQTRKTSYPTELEAKIALASTQLSSKSHRSTSSNRDEKRVYECEFCGHWHLTSRPEFSKRNDNSHTIQNTEKNSNDKNTVLGDRDNHCVQSVRIPVDMKPTPAMFAKKTM